MLSLCNRFDLRNAIPLHGRKNCGGALARAEGNRRGGVSLAREGFTNTLRTLDNARRNALQRLDKSLSEPYSALQMLS